MKAYTDGNMTLIAEDMDDLLKLSKEFDHDEWEPDEWAELSPESSERIWFYPNDVPPIPYAFAKIEEKDNLIFVTMPISEWIELIGRGMLCSVDV